MKYSCHEKSCGCTVKNLILLAIYFVQFPFILNSLFEFVVKISDKI